MSAFYPGQIVFAVADPSKNGAVLEVLQGDPEPRIKVLMDQNVRTFYASQLQEVKSEPKQDSTISLEEFHAHLTALQINNPSLSTLYSLNAARIHFIPYQFRPVLRFIRSDRPRLLIADSVGVGKTIEAGLILRELQARSDIRSVLIICPRPLIAEKKWFNEMKRFDESFIELDGDNLRFCIEEMDKDGEWPANLQKCIVPYSILDAATLHGQKKGKRHTKGLLDLDPPPRFDLVIVDEAHHIRNPETIRHQVVRFFCEHATAVLFLTATPIQLGNNDLYSLLNLLRPDLIIDQESFNHMAEPNPYINRAASAMRAQGLGWQKEALRNLEEAANTSWGVAILRNNPNFQSICKELLRENLTPQERVKMISDTENLHTFSSMINRTRRRDIGEFTVRKPETVTVPFTPEQRAIHDDILAIQADLFRQFHDESTIKFLMTTIRRQLASCLFGMEPYLKDILSRHLIGEPIEGIDDEDEMKLPPIQKEIERLLTSIRVLDAKDPKFDALKKIIHDKKDQAKNKIMLFSSFRHTLFYLYDKLQREGFRVGLIYGDTKEEDRLRLREAFEKDKEDPSALDLLLFSEVGSEGLDYQFCDCMVNYDLPWNPMRIEQRIGRIDRNGQESESVSIFNLVTPGTVDADIYSRCLTRIGVFNHSIGENEEILGKITNEIQQIAENFSLSENDRQKKLQQLADNQIRLIQEQEELEQKQTEFFGISLPKDQMKKEIDQASSFWLTPDSIERLVHFYLRKIHQKEQEFILGEKSLKTLRLSQESRDILLKELKNIPRQNNSVFRDWEKWLKGSEQHLKITFDAEKALKESDVVFMMPLHPLVKQAAAALKSSQKKGVHLSVLSDTIAPGHYEFMIYEWQYYGIKDDLQLKVVASDEKVGEQLIELLEKASDYEGRDVADQSILDRLDQKHYALWQEAKNNHIQRTKELEAFQKESLETSHRARLALLNEQLRKTYDPKIRRMRLSQIASVEADYTRRIHEIEEKVVRADILYTSVACGVIHVNC